MGAVRLRKLPPGLWRGLALAAAVAYPWLVNDYWVDVMNFCGIYMLLGLSLNIIVGYAGLFNLGHAAFYAVGAYTTAILSTRFGIPSLWLLPVSALAAAAFAYVISRPIIHLRGDYLCVVTIGFGEIVRIALINNPGGLTGGVNGIIGVPRPDLGLFTVRSVDQYYYFILFFIVLFVWGMGRLERSRIGRAWTCIREDETAAEAMGIDTASLKLLAFVLGAAGAGLAGNIYATKMTLVAPEGFNFWESCVMFCIVVLGGTGSIPGVIVASLGMAALPELFREFARARMLVFGLAMVLMMIFRPQGLWPSAHWRRQVKRERESGVTPMPSAGSPAQ
ncbi:MAG: branched-chain amino acid ABC transporter permease [Bacillota bacterium]|nr:branched-chain amino acid ABC transporter permease [Bacillota bacterium]MDI7250615.1 branched-chain amino acid ABC transporter permease [Bacillota bacterium]